MTGATGGALDYSVFTRVCVTGRSHVSFDRSYSTSYLPHHESMRIITLVLELAVLCLSLSSPTCSLPTVMDNPRDLDNDPQSEQLDPGDSMNELPSADIPVPAPRSAN